MVTVEDPEGYPVSFIHGQASPETTYEIPGKLIVNDETHKPRQRQFQRFEPGPAEVYKVRAHLLGVPLMLTSHSWDILEW